VLEAHGVFVCHRRLPFSATGAFATGRREIVPNIGNRFLGGKGARGVGGLQLFITDFVYIRLRFTEMFRGVSILIFRDSATLRCDGPKKSTGGWSRKSAVGRGVTKQRLPHHTSFLATGFQFLFHVIDKSLRCSVRHPPIWNVTNPQATRKNFKF
jgi:hypothetical protein